MGTALARTWRGRASLAVSGISDISGSSGSSGVSGVSGGLWLWLPHDIQHLGLGLGWAQAATGAGSLETGWRPILTASLGVGALVAQESGQQLHAWQS